MSRSRNRRSRRASLSRRQRSLGFLSGATKALHAPERLEARVLLASDLPAIGQMPLAFEMNVGQADEQYQFVGRGQGYNVSVSAHELLLALNKPVDFGGLPEQDADGQFIGLEDEPAPLPDPASPTQLQIELLGANSQAIGVGLDALGSTSNYYLGGDDGDWRTNVAHFANVQYTDVYSGIDVVYRGNEGNLQYDFLLDPGADPDSILLAFGNSSRLQVDGEGNLLVELEDGQVIQHAPVIFQDIDGERQYVDGGYVVLADDQVAFEIGSYDAGESLVIDPVLTYSSFLGGTGTDVGMGIGRDDAGNIYLAGYTNSTDFASTNGSANAGNYDVFVTKLSPSGDQILYSTYLGGAGDDRGWSLAADGAGNVYVTGRTGSTDFPTSSGAAQGSFGGGSWDAFVTKLDASGSLLYSTFLGGSANENDSPLLGYNLRSIGVDNDGSAWVTGMTRSGNFPVANGAQPTFGGGNRDAFVTRLAGDGKSFEYSTYLGGAADDRAQSLVVDGAGDAYITGFTQSDNFPTSSGALQTSRAGGWDNFVAKLDGDLTGASSLAYSTYLGGTSDDYSQAIAVDTAGHAYVTGLTWSGGRNFPTRNAFQGDTNWNWDGFVTKLNLDATDVEYSTFLAGKGDDRPQAITVDTAGNAYVAGFTSGAQGNALFPLVNPIQDVHGGGYWDGFVTKLHADGGDAYYSTYLGGEGDDRVNDLLVDTNGNIYLAGMTRSGNFPTVDPVQGSQSGNWDAFVAVLEDDAQHGPKLNPIPDLAIVPGDNVLVIPEVSDPDGPVTVGPTAAYSTPAGAAGNQPYYGSVGMDFDVLAPIEVTHLGVFDDGSDGLQVPLTAHLYDRDDPATPLATIVFAAGATGTLSGGTRYLELAPNDKLTLPAGFRGTIVAEGYQPTEQYADGFSSERIGTVQDGGGHIAFVGTGRTGTNGAFPTDPSNGRTNRFGAGSFIFQGQSTETVTFTATGLPPGATLNPSTGEIQWTSAPTEAIASYTIELTATDASALTATQTFSLHVVPTPGAPSSPLIVTNTANSGPGSLREAMANAQSIAGTDPVVIEFNIPTTDPNYQDPATGGTGAFHINLTSTLPTLTRGKVTIDGWSQSEFMSSDSNPLGPEIVINGDGIGFDAPALGHGDAGITLASSENVIRGLNIQGVPHYGIWINGGDFNVIQGNYVGTDETGSVAIGQARGINITGGASNNLIGTDGNDTNDDNEGNLISGANERGVDIRGTGTQYNVVAGNIIGLNAAGDARLENAIDGVLIYNNANYNLIGTNGSNDAFNENERNVISGNLARGVRIQTAHHNQISGNYIGPDPTGMLDLGNFSDGVQIRSGATYNVVGTDGNDGNDDVGDAFEWNLISGNNAFGVRIQDTDSNNNTVAGNWVGLNEDGDGTITNGSAGIFITNNAQHNLVGTNSDGKSDDLERNIASGNYSDGLLITNAHFNDLVGNWIGTDSTGTAALGNRLSGIAIYGGASNNRIGTDGNGVRDDIEGNLVAASGTWGVYLGNGNTDNNLLFGNIVGTDATLAKDWGSGNDGLRLFGGAENNQIGGPGLMGNVFANSGRDGIVVFGTATLGNPIRNNSIFGSRQLGIDINNDGVTSNDPNDADTGPLGVLNFPVLESVEILGGNLVVTGFARPNSEIDLFIAAPDVTGFGEGKTFLTTVSESSAVDGDDATGAYSYPLIGSDNTNRFAFTLPLSSLSATVEDGTAITATATLGGNTSEFSRSLAIKLAGNAPPLITGLNAPTVGHEGSFVDVSGSYTDADAIDGHIVTVDWGDDTSTTIEQVGPTVNVTDLVQYNGHWYAIILDSLKFYEAEEQAQKMGGHLVTVNDQAENEFITQLIFDTFGDNRSTWIGLNDADEEGVLTWVSGETSAYRNFFSGFADNWNGAAGQDFVLTNHGNAGTWDDRDGNNRVAAVVELTGERLFNASHLYDDDGDYTITVTVEDSVPTGVASASQTASIEVANVAPVVTFSGSTSVEERSAYVLTLAAADPGDDTIASWTVAWGDGTTSTVSGDTTSVAHEYANGDAERNISVTATDEDGTYDARVLGDLLVPSYNTNQVLRYDAITGNYLSEFASGPTQNGPTQNELGPDGRLYSTAWFSGDVVKLDATTGEFLDTVAYVREGNVRRPYGVTFGPDQLLYIASFERNEVQRFDPQTGEFLDLFISWGRGGLGGPTEVLFDAAGNLLVASWNNNSVKKYDGATGNYLGDFVGNGSGGLSGPDDMLFGPDGNFYVAGRTSNSVLRYNGSTGAFIDAFVPAGTEGLSAPTGLLFDNEGDLLVSDSDNDRVLRFDGETGAFIDEFIAQGAGGLDRPFQLTLIPSAATELTVNVTNVAPEITALSLIPAGSNNPESPSEIDENGKVELTVDFSDGIEQHEISINWMDGTLTQYETVPAGIESLTLTHQYLDDGIYSILVTVTDSAEASDSETGDLTVNNVAPVLKDDFALDRETIEENDTVTITGSFSDAGTLDTHTIVVIWGDNESSLATVNQDEGTYQATHRYSDDGPNPGISDTFDYHINVTIDDGVSGPQLVEDAATATVTNSAPVLEHVSLDKDEIDEGDSVTVSGVFRDKGLVDTHTVMVYWGDGTGSSATVTPREETAAADDWFFTATRAYDDDAPTETPFDSYDVSVKVTDDDGGNTPETTAGLVLVNNVVPSNLSLTLEENSTAITTTTEGSTVTLSGTFVDAGQNDTHTVTIKWGDGSSDTVQVDDGYLDVVDGGYLFDFEQQHQYADDSLTPYAIEVFAADDDEPAEPIQANIDLTVENVIPNSINLLLDLDTINEGDSVSLQGSFLDPGVLDTHQVVINWGDATTNDIVPLAAGVTSFPPISHTYADDRPSGTSSDDYVVTVTITDNDFVADLLVTSLDDHRVLRFDGATGELLGPFIFDDLETGSVDESGGLDSPAAMVVGPDSNIYVTSSATPGVLRFNGTTGELLDTEPFIAAGGGLSNPQALAFGPGGALYVASDSNEILRYDGATGVLLEVLISDDPGTAADETGGLDGPTGILFGPNGNLLVSSFNSDQVLKYDRTTGEFLGVLDEAQSGGLDGPRGLAINANGQLVVASSLNNTLLTYDAEVDTYRNDYGTAASGLIAPVGLGIDATGNSYVTSASNEVLRFDQHGNFLDTFVASGNLANPTAVAFLSHQVSARETVTINNVAPVILATDITLAGVGAFSNLEQFLQATGATATAALEDLGLISGGSGATYTTTDNALTASLGPNASELFVGAAGVTGVTDSDWTTRLAGAEITTTGNSDLDIALATAAKSFGFTFVEPKSDPNVAAAADSVFSVTLRSGTDLVGQLTFSRPIDTASFFGVQSLVAFDSIEIREITGGDDHEFFGQFYTGSTAGLPEGNDAILTGSFSDTGQDDTHTVYVDWGDNSPVSAIPILEGQLTFEVAHRYLDDIGPAGTAFDVNDITVTVEDDDLGVSLPAVGNARVTNVKPLVEILPGQGSTTGSILLATDLTDPGSGPTETFTYDWTISQTTFSGGNPQTQVIDSGTGSAADFTFIPQGGQLLATVTATDDDGGTDQDRAFVIVGTDLDDIITIAADGTITIETSGNTTTITVNPADADRFVVFGLDGDDVISGGASPLPLVVDGGNGTDTVTLSDGDDTAFLTSGDDVVDLGGGNNEAFLNPNSTLTVKAGTGNNTLNFSLADFGVELDMGQFDGTVQTVGIDSFDFTAQDSDNRLTAVGHIFAEGKKIRITGTGLPSPLADGNEYFVVGLSGDTFQLSETKGGVPIDLTSDGSGTVSLEHKVSVAGSFPTLVGTAQDDVITAGAALFDSESGVLSAGSTIITGDGSDTIFGRGLAGNFDLGDGDNLFIQTLDTSELAVIGGALDGDNLAAIAGSFDIQIKGGIGNDRVVFGGLSGTFDLGEGDNVFIQTLDGNELASLTGALDADSLALAQSAFDGSALATIAGALDGADLTQVFGSLDLDVTLGDGLDQVFTNWASGAFDLGGGNDIFVQALDGQGLAALTGALDSADLAMLIQSLDVSVIAGAGADQVQTSLSGTFDLGIGADIFIGSLDQAALAELGGALDADDLALVSGQLDAAGLAALSGALDSADLVDLIASLDVNVFGGPGGDLIQTSLGGTFDLGSGDNLFVGSFDGANIAQLGGALDGDDIVSLVGSLDTAGLAALGGALDGADLVTLVQSLDVVVLGGTGADQVRTSLTGTFDLGQGDNLFIGALDGFELASLGGALDGTDLATLTGALDSAALASLGGALDNAELATVIGALDVTFIGKSGNDQVQTSLPGSYQLGEGRNVFISTLDTAELTALGGALDGNDLAALIGSLDSDNLAALIGSLDDNNLATLSGALDGSNLATLIGALDVTVFGGAGDDQIQSALGGEFRLGGGDNLFVGTLDGAGLASLTGALDGSDLAALIGALDGADLATLGAAVGADVDMLQSALSTGFDAAELVALGGALDGTDLVALIGSLDAAVFGGDGNDQVQTALSGQFELGGGSNLFIGTLDGPNLAALGGALDGQDLADVLGSLDSNDLAALSGALDSASLAALGGALDSAELVQVLGALDIDYTGESGQDQVQTQLAGTYRMGGGANVFIGNLDAASLVSLGGALDGSNLATLTGALDGAELAALIGSLDGASLASLGGALDGTDLASLIVNLGVTVHGGNEADQVQSALKGEYNLADGDNLFLGTFDGPGLATLGGALDGPSLAYLIGALDGAELAALAGALDGADLVALEGALDGNNLAALAGALDGTNLVQLGGALDGSELATIIGSLDVTVNGGANNDQVQTALPGIFNLADGDNVFIGTLDGAGIAQLAGALDANDLVSVIGSLDSADLTALGGALDGTGLAALGGALDGGELSTFLQHEFRVQYESEGGNDQVESSLPGVYTMGNGSNLFIGTLDAADLASVGGALDSPELAALVGALDSANLVELINSLDGNSLAALGGALDGAELVSVLGALDVTVTGGIGFDQVQTSLAGTFDLDGGDNVFVGSLDGASLASLGGALDGADLALLTGTLDGAGLAALSGALDGQGLAALGGALDGDQLRQAIEALQVGVVGRDGNDQVQSEMQGSYELGTGNNLFIGTLDGPGLASLGGALDGADLIQLIGSLDSDDLAVITGALDGASLAALGGALDGAELATLIGALDANVTTLGGDDQVQTALGGTYDLGHGRNLFLGNLDAANLAQLGGALDGNDLVSLAGALDSSGLADLIGALDGASLATLGGALDGANLATVLGALDVTVFGGDDADQIQSGLTGVFNLFGGDNLFIGTLDGVDLATLGGALDSAELVALTGALDAAGLAALTGALDGNGLATLTGALDGDQLESWLTNRGVTVHGLDGNDEVQTAIAGTYDLGAGSNVFFGVLDGPGLASLGGALDGQDLIALIGSLDHANLVQVGGALDGFGLAALGGALDGASLADLIGALDVDVTTDAGDDVVQSALAGHFTLGDGANVFVGSLDGPNLAALGGALDGADLSAIVGALDNAGLAQLIGSLDGASLATVGGALDGQELATILGSLDVSVTGGTGKDQVQTSLDGSYALGAGENLFLGILDGPALAALGGALDSANLALLIGALDGADLSDALDGADLTAITGALDGADLVGLAGALDGTALASLGGALDSQQLASVLTTMSLYVSGEGNIDQVQTALPGTYELGAGENLFIGTLDGPGLAALSGALDDEDLATLIGSLDSTDIAQLGGALDGPALAELTGALDGVDLVSVLGALDVTVVTTGGDDQIQTQLAGSYVLGDGENLYVSTFDGANLAQLSGALDSEDLAAILGSLDGNGIVELIGSLDGAGLATLSGALDGDQLRTVLEGLHVSVEAGADKDQLQTALAGSYDLGGGDNLFIGSLDGAGLAALSGALDSSELVTLVGSLDGTDLVALGGAMDGLDLSSLVSQWSVEVTVGDGDDQVQTELGGIYDLGGANADVQDADNRNLFIGILNGAGYSQLAGALDGEDLVALTGSLDAQELAALGGALDSDQLLGLMQSLQVTVNGGDNDDQVFTSLPGAYLTGAGSDLFIGNLDGAALAALSGQLDSSEVFEQTSTADAAELAVLGGALDSADLVTLISSLEAFVNGGENADRVESALSGTFDLADGDDLFVGRLNKPALVQLGTVLDATQLAAVVSELNMHVIGGEGNDASRWGLSGVHDMGAGADSVSATLPLEHIATLEAIFTQPELALIVSAIDIEASGGDGADTFLVGTRGKYQGDAGTDQFIVGAQDAAVLGVQGDVQLDGGTGSDTFTFVGSNIGTVELTEDPEAGVDNSSDRLDFSGLQVGDTGIALDLELTTPQVLSAGILTLTMSNAAGVEEVVGTTGGDSILGNARPNILVGALEDAHLPTEYAPRDSRVQYVLLDFDCFTNGEPTVEADGSFNCEVRDDLDEGEHIYAQVERDAIQGIMTRNYQGPDPSDPWLQFEFTQTVPATDEYSIVYFNRTSPEIGGPGGLAEEIDFRNLNLTSRAFVQVNGILGEPDQPDDVSTNWITLSAKLASHELGHLAGLRHQDSFGPIGYGIHNPPGPDAYLPTYGGLAAAFETFDHLISSPASVGSTRFSDLNDLFFGERAAIKLSFNESGMVVDEDADASQLVVEIDGVDHSAQDLGELPGLYVPNTLDRGIYANKEFVVAAVDVVGELDEVGQRDFYAFAGQAGDVITIEIMSFSLNRYEGQNIDPVVALYDSSGNLLTFMETEYSAYNDDQFEAPDATIFDFVLPADDSYVFEVRTFTLIGTPDFDDLCGAGGSREGSQACVGDTGKYEALVYRFQAVNSSDLGDTLDGRGGNDILAGGSGFDVLKGGEGADILDSGPASDGDAPTLTPSLTSMASVVEEGSTATFAVSFVDSSGETAGTVDVDYGDGSGLQQYSVTGGSVDITHTYSDNGKYTIEFTVTSADGVVGSDSIEITVENAVPAFDFVEDQSVAPGRVFELTTVTFSDPGFDYALGTAFETTETFEAEVDWGDGNVEPATVDVTPGGINVLTTGSVAASHIYAEMDVFTVTVRVRDDDMIATDTWVESMFGVTVENSDPELSVVGDQIVDQARPFEIEDLGTLTDDGDTFTYTIDWGDGKIDNGSATVDTAGTTTSLTEASFDGQHTYGTAGTFQVIVTITDADGAVDTETFDVTSRKSLVALDSKGKGALSLSGNAEVTIPGSIFVNSTSSKAISASGHAVVTAAAIDVVGDVKASSNVELNPTPSTGTTAIVDPLNGLEAPTGLFDQGTFSCDGDGSHTISPGIYDQISASGTCQLVLESGIYVIDNKKFKISGDAGVTVDSDEGVFIYMKKGSFDISGNGTFDLTPLDDGPYRGLLVAQAESNTKTIKLSGNARLSGVNGTIYAPSAQVSISGNGEIVAGIIADRIRIDGNGASSLLSHTEDDTGVSEGMVFSEGQLVMDDLWVAISDPDNQLSSDAYLRVDSAIEDLNATFSPYGVNLIRVTGEDASLADFSVLIGETSPCGAFEDGVLGCTDVDGRITLISGWDWYEGESAAGITNSQYDLETIVMHELGHAIGLEHSIDVSSVMYTTLAAGEVKRSITDLDLEHLGDDEGDGGGSESLMAAPSRASSDSVSQWSSAVDLCLSTSPGSLLREPIKVSTLPRPANVVDGPALPLSGNPIPQTHERIDRHRDESAADVKIDSLEDQLESLDQYFTELSEFIPEEDKE